MFSRRDFIKAFGVVGAGFLIPLRRLGWGGSFELVQPAQPAGELYAGFILLPEGAQLPPIVTFPELAPPVLCGAGPKRRPEAKLQRLSRHQSFGQVAELAKELEFPIYTLRNLPKGLRQESAEIVRHATGEVYLASVSFTREDAQEAEVVLTVKPGYPSPYPVWYGTAGDVESSEPVVEKVDFLPSPGLRLMPGGSHSFQWIEKGVLYTLDVEDELDEREVRKLLNSLEPVH